MHASNNSGNFQKGKKLPLDWEDEEGEVTDEDEGSESSKKKEKPRRILLCKELSDLISLVRCHFVNFLTSREIRMLIYNTEIQCMHGLDLQVSMHMCIKVKYFKSISFHQLLNVIHCIRIALSQPCRLMEGAI